jgi:hypothetical protein
VTAQHFHNGDGRDDAHPDSDLIMVGWDLSSLFKRRLILEAERPGPMGGDAEEPADNRQVFHEL